MPDAPPFSPTIALLAIARIHEAELSGLLSTLELSIRGYGLMGHIRSAPGISFSELARRSRITVQSTHTAVEGLRRAGLVEDSTALAGAASSLRITSAGGALVERASTLVDELDRRLVASNPKLVEGLKAAVPRQRDS